MSDEVSNVVPVEPAATPTVKITVRPNGPFRVEGLIALVDVNGQEWDLTGKPAISLLAARAVEPETHVRCKRGVRRGWSPVF